jgi:hypothetical protein
MAAGLLLFFAGFIIAIIGVGFLVASNTRDGFSYYLTYIGIGFELAVILRCWQGVRVARRYRAAKT